MKASKVLKYCESQLGTKESPANSNNVKYNTWFYGHKVNGTNYAWCAVFLAYCFHQCGGASLFPKNANAGYAQDYVVSKCGGKWIMSKTNSNTQRRNILSKVKAGDIVTFDFGAYDSYRRHIGIVKSVNVNNGTYLVYEGNTSKSTGGSQSNGGEVCLKTRHFYDVCAIVRPKYESEKTPKIYIHVGHSNTDDGHVSKYGVEHTLNVKVSKAMAKYLRSKYNVKVYRTTGKTNSVTKLANSANKKKCDLVVSIHYNSGKKDGFEAWVQNSKRTGLGELFIKYVKKIGQNSKGVKIKPNSTILKKTEMPAIIVQCAYIDNYNDIKDWRTTEQCNKMGVALAKAAAKFVKATKK